MSGIKRDKYDKLFSDLVRERSNYDCDYCGRNFRHQTGSLHCSHFQGRRSKATRYHPFNAVSHCVGCHRKLGEQPGEFTRWMEGQISEPWVNRIIQMSKTPVKIKPWQMDELYQHMKDAYAEMLDQRNNGNIERVEFYMPDWYMGQL